MAMKHFKNEVIDIGCKVDTVDGETVHLSLKDEVILNGVFIKKYSNLAIKLGRDLSVNLSKLGTALETEELKECALTTSYEMYAILLSFVYNQDKEFFLSKLSPKTMVTLYTSVNQELIDLVKK